MTAYRLRQELRITISYVWVEGHQREKYGSAHQLHKHALLNDEMDKAAKAHWSSTFPPSEHQQRISSDEWSIFIQNRKLTGNVLNGTHDSIQEKDLVQWLTQPTTTKPIPRVPLHHLHLIDTDSTALAWSQLTLNKKKWLSKFTYNFAPFGKNMYRWGFWTHDRCPYCIDHPEDEQHFLTCPDYRARHVRHLALQEMGTRLREYRTQPLLLSILMLHLRYWLDLTDDPPPMSSAGDIQRALLDQGKIGWLSMMKGRIASSWQAIQHQYAIEENLKTSPRRWASLLVSELWNISWQIWLARNSILHDQKLGPLERIDELDCIIQEEWNLGYRSLAPADQSLFKGITIEALLDKRPAYKKTWIAQVRLARSVSQQP
jgi:hypothetical protein